MDPSKNSYLAPGQRYAQDTSQMAAPPPYPMVDRQPSPQPQMFIPSGREQQAPPVIIMQQQPMAPPHGTFVVVNTGIMQSSEPVGMQCPSCRQHIVTQVTYESGTLTWLACFGCLLIGCGLGCCFIPFCMDGTQDAVHSCPSCQQFIGRYRRL